MAAGVAHSVTSACAKGDIPGCFCAQSKEQKTSNNDWGSSGCNNNIAYGVEISKTFLSGSRDPVGKKYELQIKHNREAGRQVSIMLNENKFIVLMLFIRKPLQANTDQNKIYSNYGQHTPAIVLMVKFKENPIDTNL